MRILLLRILLLLFFEGCFSSPVLTEEDKNLTTLLKCEGEEAVLSCPPGMQIVIHLANYGRFSLAPCNPTTNMELNTQCQNDQTIPILKERCQNFHHRCVVPIDKSTFGDSCPGTPKYLDILYGCNGKKECQFVVSNEILGDPCPDTTKYLEAQFKCVVQATTTTSTTEKTTAKLILKSTSKSHRTSQSSEENLNYGDRDSEEPPIFQTKCPPTTFRHLIWPKTELNQKIRITCPIGSRGHAEWLCSKTGKWYPPEGPDLSRCVSDWSRQLYEDVDENENDFPVQLETLKEMYSYTRREQLLGGDLVEISRIMSKTVENFIGQENSLLEDDDGKERALKINKMLLETFNHLLNQNQFSAWMDLPPKKRHYVADSLLAASEHSLAYLLSSSKIGSHIAEATSETIAAKPNILAQVSLVTVYDYVKFPSLSLYREEVDSVSIPKDALLMVGNNLANVVYVAYDRLGPYMTPYDERDDFSMTSSNQKIISKILTVSLIKNRKPKLVQNLDRPVVITFHIKSNRNFTNPQCVWWNREQLNWSKQGCSLVDSNETTVICHCSHLTHFAVLMDVNKEELPFVHNIILTFITYAGCTLSIFCLTLSFLAFSIFGDSSCDRVCVHKNLCLTLGIAEAIFLFGIFRTQEKIVCSIVAGALQYFFIAAFAWMLLEGFQLYYMLVQVFSPKHSRKPYLYLFGYGVPAIILGISAYWNPSGFGTVRYCWLQTENYFILSFIGPVAFILACNLVFLIMTLFVVCKHSKVGYKPCKHDTDTIKTIRGWLKGSMALVFLLGLTWTFGLFWVDQRHVLAAYAFTICNSLQGLFILLFHVIFDTKMKKDYRRWLLRNNWLPLCLRSYAVDLKDRPGTAFLPSTATSSAHSGSSGSSNTSDLVYPPQVYHGSTDYHSRVVASIDPRYNHSVQMLLPGQQIRLEHDSGTYEYATIPYDDMINQGPRPYQHMPRTPIRVSTPRIPPCYAYGTCPSGPHSMTYRIDSALHQCCHHNYSVDLYPPSNFGTIRSSVRCAPPNFKPPPPPAYHPSPQGLRSPVPSSSSTKPPSDDSAYSEEGSFMQAPNLRENSGSSGTLLLRMDLSKNPPVFYEGH